MPMQATITNAVIPKARGIYAKRLSPAEYEELMRRRTVTEVAAILRRHPYFSKSLASLSPADPHRGQIEELLTVDVFEKYLSLARYEPTIDGFASYHRVEVEVRQILTALQLLSIGVPGVYLQRIPAYLVGKLKIDLFEMGRASSFAEVVQSLEHTIYYRVLREACKADPTIRDFPALESTLLRFYYETTFGLIDRHFSGPEHRAVQGLFLQQAEIYNLELLFRVKTFFPTIYTPDQIRSLLLPYHYRLPPRLMDPLIEASNIEALQTLYKSARILSLDGMKLDMDTVVTAGSKVMHRNAEHLLRLTSSPAAALAAFVALADIERENVINVVEGVRYGMQPEKIRSMLAF